jgi:hypothetical protein
MRNITFSADPEQIELARTRARQTNTTLNEAFRQWLAEYAAPNSHAEDISDFLSQFQHFRAGKMPTRDELNER